MFLPVTHDENLVTNTKIVSLSNSSQSCTMVHLPLSHLYTQARQKNTVTKNPKQNFQTPLCSLHISGWCQSLMLCSVHITRWCHVINLKSNFSPCHNMYLSCLMQSSGLLPFTFNPLKSIMSLLIFSSFKIPLSLVFKSSWSQRALGVDSTVSRTELEIWQPF
jgi:hypothetical protein